MNLARRLNEARERLHRAIDERCAAEAAKHMKSWRRSVGQKHKRKGPQ